EIFSPLALLSIAFERIPRQRPLARPAPIGTSYPVAIRLWERAYHPDAEEIREQWRHRANGGPRAWVARDNPFDGAGAFEAEAERQRWTHVAIPHPLTDEDFCELLRGG